MVARRLRSLGRNLRAAVRRPRILAIREAGTRPYRDFLRWLEREDPETRALFDLRCVFERIWGLDRYGLILNWLPDPLKDRDPKAHAWMQCLEARGVPVVNGSEFQSRCRKSTQSRILREAGFDTPPVGGLDDFDYPVVVRADVGHGALVRLDRPGPVDLPTPVASPFVETRGADGFYRKYRYLLAGDRGTPRHLQISSHWCVRMDRRDLAPGHVEEELAYTSGKDRNHDELNRAREALGLDFVAFDYSYRPGGRMVIWEANPFPTLWVHRMDAPEFAYQRAVMDRLYGVWRDDLRSRLGRAPVACVDR